MAEPNAAADMDEAELGGGERNGSKSDDASAFTAGKRRVPVTRRVRLSGSANVASLSWTGDMGVRAPPRIDETCRGTKIERVSG